MTLATDKDSTFCVMLKAKKLKINKQECIPVGCIPSAAVAISGEGEGVSARRGVYPWGVSAGGVCPGRVCLGDVHHPL